MIFPSLKGKRFGYVNLNLEARSWLQGKDLKTGENPLLDPAICQKMVADVHKRYNLDFSYGGWMEDRSVLWKGSYLDRWNTFTHLGVDVNVPEGTEIAAPFDGDVAKIDDDHPEEGGWGPRVILKHASLPIYMIFAHLDRSISCKVGQKLVKGQVFAKVGKAPYNGNWFPHLHLQTIAKEYYEKIEKEDLWGELDGYGASEDIKENSALFGDPIRYVPLS